MAWWENNSHNTSARFAALAPVSGGAVEGKFEFTLASVLLISVCYAQVCHHWPTAGYIPDLLDNLAMSGTHPPSSSPFAKRAQR